MPSIMSLLLPSKKQVRQSFEKAASTYDSAARAQRWVCARLVEHLPAALTPAVILDAGCGTGFAQEILALRFPAAHRIAMDFSPAMISLNKRLEFALVGDVEHIPLRNESIGLYWSSLTAQWCDPDALAREACRVLWPSGALALATLGAGTFRELDEAFARVDRHRHILTLQPPSALEDTLSRAGFRDIHIHTEPCVTHSKDLKTLLRTIKSIGANQIGVPRRPGLMGKNAWRKLEAAYESRRAPQGLPLTYQVIFCTARKAG
jgi:malonyl-CoA O-methyltransferase